MSLPALKHRIGATFKFPINDSISGGPSVPPPEASSSDSLFRRLGVDTDGVYDFQNSWAVSNGAPGSTARRLRMRQALAESKNIVYNVEGLLRTEWMKWGLTGKSGRGVILNEMRERT